MRIVSYACRMFPRMRHLIILTRDRTSLRCKNMLYFLGMKTGRFPNAVTGGKPRAATQTSDSEGEKMIVHNVFCKFIYKSVAYIQYGT